MTAASTNIPASVEMSCQLCPALREEGNTKLMLQAGESSAIFIHSTVGVLLYVKEVFNASKMLACTQEASCPEQHEEEVVTSPGRASSRKPLASEQRGCGLRRLLLLPASNQKCCVA